MPRRSVVSRRGFLARGVAAGVVLTAARPARASQGRRPASWPILREHEVPLQGLAPAHDGLVVVHVSDVHVGILTPPRRLERGMDMIRAAAPDLIFLTGDYLWRGRGRLGDLASWARRLPAPAVACLGNHDHWVGADEVRRVLEDAGVRVLSNTHEQVSLRGGTLTVIGVDDAVTGHDDVEQAFRGAERNGPRVVLSHHPLLAGRAVGLGADLVLAGHTHGGVFRPLGTIVLAQRVAGPYVSGWYRVGSASLYVNRGLGDSGIPIRVGRDARPEIARLVLRRVSA